MGLFKTINHYHEHTTGYGGPSKIEVHEHKAPTDKSVELLNETEEKARKNLLKKVVLKNNMFEGAVQAVRSVHEMGAHIDFRFKINGEEFEFSEFASDWDLEVDERALLQKLFKKVSEVLTAKLMERCKRELYPNKRKPL